ncbi:hypothetical protein JTB14_030387 [Gonioctena quinquepunctata]|nr:hypothetical protein JTB14_030387 [Gonioctena quinquepunctata]
MLRSHLNGKINSLIVYHRKTLPEEDPIITGVEMEYQIGDEINLNCTSGKSHPASILHWYINEQRIQTKEALIPYPTTHHPKDLVTSSLGLTFRLSNHHFRGGSMRVKCVASIAPILYQSDKESVVQTQSVPIREALLLVRSSSKSSSTPLVWVIGALFSFLLTT